MDIARILSERDLTGASLSGISLGGCDLRGKNLRGADLSYAHLGRANLSGADLRNAKLCHANLGAANLTGADMRFCDLREANLNGAHMDGADLREAIGLHLTAPVPLSNFVKPIRMEVTEEYEEAQKEGYFPITHWGKAYVLDGHTLSGDTGAWEAVKTKLGDTIFGDKKTFSEVRLVKRYKHYSQWAYMISKKGFERIAASIGLPVHKK